MMDPFPKRALMSFITLSTALAWVRCESVSRSKEREDEVEEVEVERRGGKKGGKKIRNKMSGTLAFASLSPSARLLLKIEQEQTLTLSEAEEPEDVSVEAEALEVLEALAATARDAKEAIVVDGTDVEEGTADAGDNAGENERREREAATAPPPIRLSAIAVARSMVLV
jgi:hypothetical protein